MPDDRAVARVVREWVLKAENDLKNAAHTVELREGCPTDTACFHAQQCAEKYLKAFLTLQGLEVPRTHDVEQLFRLLPNDLRGILSIEDQRRLTRYATTTRYPGAYAPISLAEARKALKNARKVRREIRRLLPRTVTRKEQ